MPLIPETNRKKYALLLIPIVGVALAIGWRFWDSFDRTQVAPSQETPGWARWPEHKSKGKAEMDFTSDDPSVPPDQMAGIFLRADQTGNLPLKHKFGSGIYLFDVSTKQIHEADDKQWRVSNLPQSVVPLLNTVSLADVTVSGEAHRHNKNPS